MEALLERFLLCRDQAGTAYRQYKEAALKLVPRISAFAENLQRYRSVQGQQRALLENSEDSVSLRSVGPTVRGTRTATKAAATVSFDEPVQADTLLAVAVEGPRLDFPLVDLPRLPSPPTDDHSSVSVEFVEESSASNPSGSGSALTSAERLRLQRASLDSTSILSQRSPSPDRRSFSAPFSRASVENASSAPRTPGCGPPRTVSGSSPPRAASVPRSSTDPCRWTGLRPPKAAFRVQPRPLAPCLVPLRNRPAPAGVKTRKTSPVRMAVDSSPLRAASVPRDSARVSGLQPPRAVTAATCSVLRALRGTAPSSSAERPARVLKSPKTSVSSASKAAVTRPPKDAGTKPRAPLPAAAAAPPTPVPAPSAVRDERGRFALRPPGLDSVRPYSVSQDPVPAQGLRFRTLGFARFDQRIQARVPTPPVAVPSPTRAKAAKAAPVRSPVLEQPDSSVPDRVRASPPWLGRALRVASPRPAAQRSPKVLKSSAAPPPPAPPVQTVVQADRRQSPPVPRPQPPAPPVEDRPPVAKVEREWRPPAIRFYQNPIADTQAESREDGLPETRRKSRPRTPRARGTQGVQPTGSSLSVVPRGGFNRPSAKTAEEIEALSPRSKTAYYKAQRVKNARARKRILQQQ